MNGRRSHAPTNVLRFNGQKVKVIDANCSSHEKRGEADQYDYCRLHFRTEKGKHGEIVDIPGIATLSVLFVGTHPVKVHAGERRGKKSKGGGGGKAQWKQVKNVGLRCVTIKPNGMWRFRKADDCGKKPG